MNDDAINPEDEGADEGTDGLDSPGTDDAVEEAAPDLVTVEATLLDGETVTFKVPRGSTLLDLSRQLHLPEPAKRVATDEDDQIITPDFVFTEDYTSICYVVNAKGGAA